jgi:antitoxin component YwqK of YwqJK toxin-antitoxin module
MKSRLLMLRINLVIVAFLLSLIAFAQDNEINPNGHNVFYHPNGKVSSEGMMREGKPDGYWKTYNEKGILIAEGNRVNYLLDSIWNFYNDSAKLVLQVNYREGLKNGIRRTFRTDEVLEENFIDDVKHGLSITYYSDGSIKRTVNFVNGFEDGTAREFSPDGTVIALVEYRRGFVVDRENINRVDRSGLKQGRWKFFYDNGKVKTEGIYRDDKRNGYFKDYDEKGMLVDIAKYVNDVRQEETPELVKLDVKTDYYPDGKPKTVASYLGDIPQGVRREYDNAGRVVASFTFDKGKLIAEGIIDDEGVKDGQWKEYYADGQLRSEGLYSLGNRVGRWRFYHPDGSLEQEGNYNNQGNPEGPWKWYYANGNVHREESFRNGLSDGPYTEFNESGTVLVQGEYVDGLEEGFWKYEYGDTRQEGSYSAGKRNGLWQYFYDNGQLSFEGSYIDDNPNGRHTWYFPDGKKRDQGEYLMGLRTGDWIQYNQDGQVFLVIAYENGIERRYDGIRIKPDFEETEEP